MKKLIIISSFNKYLFESLVILLNIDLNENLLNKILKDSNENQVGAKKYQFKTNSVVKITGHVDEYEPESILLNFENVNKKQIKELEVVFESYEFAFGTGSNFRSIEESIIIYKRGIKFLNI